MYNERKVVENQAKQVSPFGSSYDQVKSVLPGQYFKFFSSK